MSFVCNSELYRVDDLYVTAYSLYVNLNMQVICERAHTIGTRILLFHCCVYHNCFVVTNRLYRMESELLRHTYTERERRRMSKWARKGASESGDGGHDNGIQSS